MQGRRRQPSPQQRQWRQGGGRCVGFGVMPSQNGGGSGGWAPGGQNGGAVASQYDMSDGFMAAGESRYSLCKPCSHRPVSA